jgi:hypothetical protein
MSIFSLADFMKASSGPSGVGVHRHRFGPGDTPGGCLSEGWRLLVGHQRGPRRGHTRGLFHGHGHLARSLEGYASALAGALGGGVAAGYAAGWVFERTSRDTPGIEDIGEGFADLGGIIPFGFLGASAGCYVALRLRRHAAAGPTAFTLLLLTVASPLPVLLPGSPPVLWPVFLLGAPLLARAIGVRVPRHRRREEPR